MILSVSDTQHNNALPCTECRYAECRVLFTIMLNVVVPCLSIQLLYLLTLFPNS